MKKSRLKEIIKEEIESFLEADNLYDATEEDPLVMRDLSAPTGVKLNMRKVLKLIKDKGYSFRIEGSKIIIKSIRVYTKYGWIVFEKNGRVIGDDLWGADIKSEAEVIPSIEEFIEDQKETDYYKRPEVTYVKETSNPQLNVYTVWIQTDDRFDRNFLIRAESPKKALQMALSDDDIGWDEDITNKNVSLVDQDFKDNWEGVKSIGDFLRDPLRISYLYDAGT